MTKVTGINTAGELVGTYADGSGGHGFLLQAGVLTTIEYPGSVHTYVQGLNDQGQIVGYSGPGRFVYDIATQTFTVIKYPHANPTYALAINNNGTVAGYFRQNGINTGFQYSNGKFRPIVYPGSSNTYVNAVSDLNQLVGLADTLGSNQFFYFVWTAIKR
jgi:uncharacterized membrane protein